MELDAYGVPCDLELGNSIVPNHGQKENLTTAVAIAAPDQFLSTAVVTRINSMFILKAIIVILTSVASIQFTSPQAGEHVSHSTKTLRVSWLPSALIFDLEEYVLGYCSFSDTNDCRPTSIIIETYSDYVDIEIDVIFPYNGAFNFCVYPPDLTYEAPCLYLGPEFEIV